MLGECAPPFQLRRTVFIPPTLLCWALSWSGPGVGVGVASDCAQYLPPVLKSPFCISCPPQTIISLPVHAAMCWYRLVGAFAVLVAVQLSMLGLYLPPVFSTQSKPQLPPQTIISLPVHTAVCWYRLVGALLVL